MTCNSLAVCSLRGIVENEILDLGWGAGQEGFEGFQERGVLQLGGLGQAGEYAEVLRAGALRVPRQIFRKMTSGRRARSAWLLVGGPSLSIKAKTSRCSRAVGRKRLRKVSNVRGSVLTIATLGWSSYFWSMARQPHIEYPGAIYHVMNRGDRREPIVRSANDAVLFVRTL
jgi:hypothetical protein